MTHAIFVQMHIIIQRLTLPVQHGCLTGEQTLASRREQRTVYQVDAGIFSRLDDRMPDLW